MPDGIICLLGSSTVDTLLIFGDARDAGTFATPKVGDKFTSVLVMRGRGVDEPVMSKFSVCPW